MANHVVGDGPTKMIGARHGAGRLICASISESPVAVAGKGPVATLAVAGAPLITVVQLTIARKLATGFVPRSASGTGGPLSRTSPSTVTSSLPLLESLPEALSICHGSPPPLMPRIGLVEPTNGTATPTIVWNWRTFLPSELAAADPVPIRPIVMIDPRTNTSHLFIMSHLFISRSSPTRSHY